MADIRIYKDNTAPSVLDTIQIGGTPFDLTSSTVKFQMRAEGSSTLKVDAAATITTAAAGEVRYDWVAGNVDTVGDYVAWWRVTTAGKSQDTQEFAVYIVDHALPAGNLCTLGDVREYLQKPTSDTQQDQVLRSLISRASRLIQQYASREFVPTTSAARTFPVPHLIVPLSPYDLRSATTVTYNNGGGDYPLTAGTDYMLGPVNAVDGVYQYVHLSGMSLAAVPPPSGLPGVLTVTGAWGFATVPEDVRQACITTVGIWARRDVQAFTQTFNLDEARLERPESLPSQVKGLLEQYRVPAIA